MLTVVLAILGSLLVFAAGIVVGIKRGVPFVGIKRGWTIGIYTGPSPLKLAPAPGVKQPVLTGDDVTDINALFVADPFMIREGDTWHMFVEVWNRTTNKGDIGHATSPDAIKWTWSQIVLVEPFHLSYPLVFKHEGVHYMIPETHQANAVRLYRGDPFPSRWTHVKDILPGCFTDASLIQDGGKWYMFVETWFSVLKLFVADHFMGPWREHPRSPLYVGDQHFARCGGRVTRYDNKIYRYNQDVAGDYGNQLRAFEITTLTPTDYAERQVENNPILKPTGQPRGWNARRMHHCDPHQLPDGTWIACVDGFGDRTVFGLSH